MLPTVEISERAARRLRQGHVWVFRSEVVEQRGVEPGAVVWMVSRHRSGGTNSLGTAFFNPASLITLRLIDRDLVEPDSGYWLQRILKARRLRTEIAGDGACRLLHSEADEIPGLIVDRYEQILVMQTLCLGAERLKELFAGILEEQFSPRAIVERNDGQSRRLEGLELRSGLLSGRLEGPVEIVEGRVRFLVDPLLGQKTGGFLDQRENRIQAAGYARGRCLDVFCYQGGFGLQLKQGGAEEVILVDQSEPALRAAAAAARLNGLAVTTREANAFDFLKGQQVAGERYDVVVLDPPAFAKSRKSVAKAVRGYKEINLRAMRLLREGGLLITCSCSYHLLPELFEEMLQEAARDAGRAVQVLERRSQSRDHPERLGFPESRYLKCFVLRML